MTRPIQSERGICYVVLVFNDVTQLFCCLWSTWDARNTYILMVDEKSDAACKSLCQILSECFENVSCICHNGSWGGYSLVSAALCGIQAGLNGDFNWQHLFLISGNHVALQDQDRIHSCLTIGKSYLRSTWISRIKRPSEADFPALNLNHQRVWGWWEEIPGVKMIMTGIRSQLPEEHLFSGSQWAALSRSACVALSGPQACALSTFFRHTFVADEMFFHTTVRATESPENIVWMDTTWHPWHGGRATYLDVGQYEAAARRGWWFGRKVPKSIAPNYVDTISRHCRTLELDSFVDLVNASSRGSTIKFDGDSITVARAADREEDSAPRRCNYERLIAALRKVAGTEAVVGEQEGGSLEVRIEPAAMQPGCSPVVGVVRSTDGKVAWLTIQLQAKWFSQRIASLLLSSNDLRGVIDDTFEGVLFESEFREFFQRKLRTAYVFEVDCIESSESTHRLRAFFKLLVEAWACLSPASGWDGTDDWPKQQIMEGVGGPAC